MFWYIFFRKAIAAKLEALGGKEFNYLCHRALYLNVGLYLLCLSSCIIQKKNACKIEFLENLLQIMSVKLEYWSACSELFQGSKEENMPHIFFIAKPFLTGSCL